MTEKNLIQTFVPVSVHGRMTLRGSSRSGSISPMEAARIELEVERRQAVQVRRMYYEGSQFSEANQEERVMCPPGSSQRKIPEHRRLHSYSTQIQECVDFLANRLGAAFSIEAADSAVQSVLNDMVVASDTIYALDDQGEIAVVTDDVLREALIAGDTPVYAGWDPVEERVFLEFWECEAVEFLMSNRSQVDSVIRYDMVWMPDPTSGIEREVEERVVYRMEMNAFGIPECLKETYVEDDDTPQSVEWLGVGRIPWALLRSDAKGLRAVRGESLITDQAMATADRYNAVEQTGYLIARYNSHSNVVVIGDAASLKLESDGRVSKDVADVLTFPGGTAVEVLTLPTSPEMIDHQRMVLSEALHAVFGVTRTDPESIQGLGGVSGYALEILNQKTEGTFSRIARNWRKDWIGLLDLVLDVAAWKRDASYMVMNVETMETRPFDPDSFDVVEVGEIPVSTWWDVDPGVVFPNRKIGIRMGSGYIVDDVKIRDDFVANLISREEALRQRGLDNKTIKRIVEEIDDAVEKAKPETPEIGMFGVAPQVQSIGTAVGSTVAGDTERPGTDQA